jgi:AcrR family transcriptional regulator
MPKSDAQDGRGKATSGEATRALLTSAATALIVERGWGSVTTRAVAERAGVNQALVHYHFGSMDNLLREAVLATLMPEITAVIDEMLDERPITESIKRVIHELDRFGLETELGMLMLEAILQATRDEHVLEAMGAVMGAWLEPLEPRLQLAQKRGVIRDDIDAASLARVLGAVLDGFVFQRMADPEADPERVADTLIQLLSPPGEDHA